MHSSIAENDASANNSILVLCVACLVVLATGLFIPQLADAFRIKNHVVALGGYACMLLWLARAPRAAGHMPLSICIALSACGAALVLSNCTAAQPMIAWRASLEILPLGLLLWVLAQQPNHTQTARTLQRAWVLAALVVAALALQQTLKPHWLDTGLTASGKLAAFSTLGNPIWASLVLLVALPLTVHAAVCASHRGLWCLPALVLIALWATQSRQAWLALVLMAWVAIIWKGSRWQRRLALAAVALLLCGLPFVDFSADAFHSLKGRLLIMRGAWQMFLDHPLTGLGLGHVGAAYPPYQAALLRDPAWQTYAGHAAVVDDAHNEFLQWAATTGVLGLVGFTLLCSIVAWLGWRSAHVRAQLWHWYLGYVGLLATLLFTGIQAQSALCLLLVCCLAVVLGGALAPSVPQAMARPAVWTTRALILAFAVAAGLWAQQDMRASYREGQGDRLMQDRDSWLAQEAYTDALALDSDRGILLKKHASILYLDGRYNEALTELARAKTLTGDTGVALLEGEILAKMGRDVEAIAAYQALVASFPQLLSPRFILGQLYYRQKQYVLSRAEFQRVVDVAPSAFNPHLTQDKVRQQKQMAAAFITILDRLCTTDDLCLRVSVPATHLPKPLVE